VRPKVQIVGILNVTPDSYFDGGAFVATEAAVARAGEMLAQGADWIEVGGESTGPNSRGVSVSEELKRVIPVIEAIHKTYPDALISVDTYKSIVADEAIRVGSTMVNDVTAGRFDPDILRIVQRMGTKIVLMYSKDPTPRTTIHPTQYDDVIATIKKFLVEQKKLAMDSGIAPDRIILDPGLGHFVSSDARYSFEIIARLREFEGLGCPLFLSPSRKSFLAGAENLKTADRLPGTIAASVLAVVNGATYIRTHDVLEMRRTLEIAEKIEEAHDE
jgi:dihydropteroate synthase